MPDPKTRPAWQSLFAHAATLRPRHLRELFAEHPRRFEDFSLGSGALLMDFSKQRITRETLEHLHELARACDVEGWRERMLAGEHINHTENRAVLHMALRAPATAALPTRGESVLPEVHATLARLREFCEAIHGGSWRGHSGDRITDVVNLGIGGSDLGPRMVSRTLAAYQQPDLKVHYVSNMDGADLAPLLARLNPRSTLFVVVSKTFGTQETLANARTARAWLQAHVSRGPAVERHFVAVSSNLEATAEFGIPPANVFQLRDWVGGRFSLWSPVGLSIALAIGFHHFEALLAGAHAMDQHFCTAPARDNLPLTLALLDIWNINCIGAHSHGVFPYSQSLELFPAYLQQLEMESTGKSVDRQGQPMERKSCPIIWGSAGTNGQHSFFQLLHQGTDAVPLQFIGFTENQAGNDVTVDGSTSQKKLCANLVAQIVAFAKGKSDANPNKNFPGERPSSLIRGKRLTPAALGTLLAHYENKIMFQGFAWNLNSFDQEGVQLGKVLTKKVLSGDMGSELKAYADLFGL